MKYLSLCSGIEAATAAWHSLGWTPVAFSEIDAFPSAVLAHHYPDTPNWGDMTRYQEWPDADVDVLVGGTPCQSFSVAGLRAGLADPRGNLMLTYLAIAERYRPDWVVWENVPGVLSSNEGRDFAAFLGGLAELGYGFAYRVLDAQFFGVAQRRRRVFVVGHAGDWRRAASVLFEPESLRGDPAPRRGQGERIANSLVGRPDRCGGNSEGQRLVCMAHGQANAEVRSDGGAPALTCLHEAPIVAHALRADGFDASEDGTGRGTPLIATTLRARDQAKGVDSDCTDTLVPVHAFDASQSDVIQYGDKSGPLDTDGHTVAVAFDLAQITSKANRTRVGEGLPASKLNRAGQMHAATASAVRRLTPRECERLQGFPDDFTLIPYRGKPAADGPRYKALGNSMAVPVMHWIGKRIAGSAARRAA